MLELLCLDAEEYLMSRRDGEYVALREEADGTLTGLTRQGAVHVVAFEHDRPVLLERRAFSEAAGAEPPRARVEGRRALLDELAVELPCDGGRLLSDSCAALPDGRVLGLRWCSASWTELSPPHPRHPLVARWGAARALVRGGGVSGGASVLWVAPLLLADGRCGRSFFCDVGTMAGPRVRVVGAGEPVARACWEGAAVTVDGALVYGRRRRHPRLGWTDVAAREEGGWVATHADGSTFDGRTLVAPPEPPLSERTESAIPRPPCNWRGGTAWLDPFSWSMRDAAGVELWGDNGEPGWWPVAVRGGQCVAVVLSRPLRVVRHPVGDSEGQSLALACRAAQLRLHAALARHAARPELASPHRRLSRALELFCLARVARRLDPPLWPRLLPEPAAAVREALALSPHLASLLLPIALHEGSALEGQALAAQLLALQLRLGLLADARDTIRFAAGGRADSPVLVSHCRSLRVHRRPLALLRLVALLLPLDEGVAERASLHYCAPHAEQPPLHLWHDLVLPLATALGLGSPVLAADSTLRLPMTAETRQLLSHLLSPRVAAPLRLAGALLLLRAHDIVAAKGDTVLKEGAPASWSPLLDMLE